MCTEELYVYQKNKRKSKTNKNETKNGKQKNKTKNYHTKLKRSVCHNPNMLTIHFRLFSHIYRKLPD